jgi:Tfp pilus assembly protein PilN
MTRVNLLPPELREAHAVRRRTSLIALGGVAGLALLALLYLLQLTSLSSAQRDLHAQQRANSLLSRRISELQPYADLQQQLAAKKQLKDSLYVDEVSWSGVLLDVSRVIPTEAYLSNLTGTLTAGTVTATPPTGTVVPGGNLIGSMSFSGVADGTTTLAGWLARLGELRGWVNPWVNTATESGASTGIYQFDGGVDLTIDAATERGRGVAP